MRSSDSNARVNIYQDDLTRNANAHPLAGGLALLQKKFLPLGLEHNKDKSTIWKNPNGHSHNSNIVERTGMKRADAPIIFHLNSNLDDATNNTATTATLPLDSERPFHNETEKTELNILLDKRTDFTMKLMTLTENGLPIHIAQALLRDAAGSDANWRGYPKPRCQRNGPSGWSGLPSHPGRGRLDGGAGETALHPDA